MNDKTIQKYFKFSYFLLLCAVSSVGYTCPNATGWISDRIYNQCIEKDNSSNEPSGLVVYFHNDQNFSNRSVGRTSVQFQVECDMTGTGHQLGTITPDISLSNACSYSHSIAFNPTGGTLSMMISNSYPASSTCYFNVKYLKCVYR